MRRTSLLILLALVWGSWSLTLVHATSATLAYAGLRACYPIGMAPGSFTLTARVDTTDTYRLTHTVILDGNAPGIPETVYSGRIEAGAPHTATIAGGVVAVPGAYRLIGALYLANDDILLAETSTTILVAENCPPQPPPPPPTPKPNRPVVVEPPADIRWSQAITTTQSPSGLSLLSIVVRGRNIGKGAGRSDGILSYDPNVLRLLDATQFRSSDWVRERNDSAGKLIIALGNLAPNELAMMRIRFVILQHSTTTVRLVRGDEQDRANPLFLPSGMPGDQPVDLSSEWNGTTLVLTGRGYKPGEPLSIWSNTEQGDVLALEGAFVALSDEDGRIQVSLPAPEANIVSIVVYGRMSDVVGVAGIRVTSGLER